MTKFYRETDGHMLTSIDFYPSTCTMNQLTSDHNPVFQEGQYPVLQVCSSAGFDVASHRSLRPNSSWQTTCLLCNPLSQEAEHLK